MLDASAPGLLLSALDGAADYVQTSEMLPSAEPEAEIPAEGFSENISPSNIQIAPLDPVNENEVAELLLTFDDPDQLGAHTIEVDWGDGSGVEKFNLAEGSRFFGTTHQYLDDNPTATSVDVNTVSVRVADPFEQFAAATAPITVSNVAPSNLQIAPLDPVNENGVAELLLTFDDPGTLDTHTIEVDWGDGSALETFRLDAGARFFGTTHQYLDDNPTATSVDVNAVTVTVIDDDGGEVTGAAPITVSNVAPSNLQIAPLAPVDENGVAQLALTFDDPGTLDTHVVEVNWGDGSAVETFNLSVGARFFATTHQYLDDNPTATLADVNLVTVRVIDDDGDETADSAPITVRNIAPTNLQIRPPGPIDENGVVDLEVAFDDVGTLDAHSLRIDWGDGTPLETVAVPAGERTLTVGHQYLDDNPTVTSFDVYTVSVTVVDDDTGERTATADVTVLNVAPSNVRFTPLRETIDEGSEAAFTVSFADPGTQDSHTYSIDWGDGTADTGVVAGRNFDVRHVYADDGEYTAMVVVFDDDSGVDTAAAVVTVNNVAPTLTVVDDQTIDEGGLLSLVDLGAFVDPGFDNPLNTLDPANGGETVERFTYFVDWGDGTPVLLGAADIDSPGAAGSLTAGSFDGSHIYADDGVYTVAVQLRDDDVGIANRTFLVTVENVTPTMVVTGDRSIDEGALLSIVDIATFTDPGFDNPLNTGDPSNGEEVEEFFTYDVDWGDGTAPNFGFAQIDAPGGRISPTQSMLTAGSLDAQHTYADNGVYTVTVFLTDDDGGLTEGTLTVTVNNVDPTLTGVDAPRVVTEGQSFTLAALLVGLEDPGFDNALNVDPSTGGETLETFTATSVDWGDGTAVDALSIVDRVSGAPGVATTAGFDHAPHTYADNGLYAVAVKIADDDGSLVTRTFQIRVDNVAPSLALTDEMLMVDEGSTITIADLGAFTDPGFDNPLNVVDDANGGETVERFSYTIDWGDGTTIDVDQLPAALTGGSPGVLTTGSIANSHRYLDNDADNIYTITVTLSDDDGGVDVQTVDVFVRNVNPTLDPLAATDVTRFGTTTLDLQFSDPGADSFEVLVDWGDKLNLPEAERFVVETVHVGPTPQAFTLVHMYDGPPNPDNPSGNITISVKIHDDDFGTPMIVQIGESNLEIVVIGQPGIGNQNPIAIDTTPQVPLLAERPRTAETAFVGASAADVALSTDGEIRGSAGDTKASNERFLELRVIRPDGSESEGYRLKSQVLKDLRGLFQKLPDNHYAIYLMQTETDSQRLVIEVFIRDGKLVDPSDDAEGARDRPPTNEAEQRQFEIEESDDGERTAAITAPTYPTPVMCKDVAAPVNATASRYRSAIAGAALALSAAAPAGLVDADPRRWRRLRFIGYRNRKNRPK